MAPWKPERVASLLSIEAPVPESPQAWCPLPACFWGLWGSLPGRAPCLGVASCSLVSLQQPHGGTVEGGGADGSWEVWRSITHSSFVLTPCTSYPSPQRVCARKHARTHATHREKWWALLGWVSLSYCHRQVLGAPHVLPEARIRSSQGLPLAEGDQAPPLPQRHGETESKPPSPPG